MNVKAMMRRRVFPGGILFLGVFLLFLPMVAYASGKAAQIHKQEAADPAAGGGKNGIDAAIAEAASYFIPRLPGDAKVALISFDAPTMRLSDYIIEELWHHFEDSQKFIMVDRRNQERIEEELQHQMGSGRVDDEMAVSITKQYGAQILVHGQMSALGEGALGREYRLSIYATDVEKAVSSQHAFNFVSDSRLVSMLNTSSEDEVAKAISEMARAVSRKTTIVVGRISYVGTQTVSSFSAWLKNSIIASANRHGSKFLVASEHDVVDYAAKSRGLTVGVPPGGSPVQAIVSGNYTPLDSGAEVSLFLNSSDQDRLLLASAQFVIPEGEINSRKLSLLPDKDKAVISISEFKAKHQVLEPYAGGDNEWVFTISPDRIDGIYYDGDFMYMQIYSERDCYFRIIHVDVNGYTQIIYPVAPNDINFLRGGESRWIPDNTYYLMGPPFGEEVIMAAAYDQPFAVNNQPFGPAPLSAEIINRSMLAESDEEEPIRPSATARFSYTILPK